MRFRLIHLLGLTTLVCLVFGIGKAIGWYVAVALAGFGMLAMSLFNCRARPGLSVLGVWCAFLSSLALPAFGFVGLSPQQNWEDSAIVGWQAAYSAVLFLRGPLALDLSTINWVRFLAVTITNGILSALPLWTLIKLPGRKVIAGITAVGAACAWSFLIHDDPLYVGYYLWATTMSLLAIILLLGRAATVSRVTMSSLFDR